jgi:RimJ/RimL family protein N-acetyltransferase
MAFQLETERLIIREYNDSDADFIIELLNTPGWLAFIGDRKIKTTEDALKYIKFLQSSYEQHGFGMYCIVQKDGNVKIGMSGLVKRAALDHADIGFAYLPEYSGKGYAYEAAIAVKNYAVNQLKMKELLAITVPANEKSIQLIRKIGLKYDKNSVMDGEELMIFKEEFA